MQRVSQDDGNPLYAIGLPLGGLLLGFGVISLIWSFGSPEGPINQQISNVGFSALDNIMALPPADYSIGMVVAGLLVLVFLNASAWRRTGGY